MTVEYKRMQQIRGSTEQWIADYLVPLDGEIAVERATGGQIKIKLGDGATPYQALPYILPSPPFLPKGSINAVTTTPPAGGAVGDVWINTGTGNVNAGWAAPAAGLAAVPGDQLIMSAGGLWNLIPTHSDLTGYVTEAELEGSTGAALVGFIQGGTGAILRDALVKMRERVSVSDFSGATDSQRLQRAIDFAKTRGGEWDVLIDGAYTVSDIASAANVRLLGGKLTATSGAHQIIAIAAASDYFIVEGVVFDGLLLEDTGGVANTAACIIQQSGIARSVGLKLLRNKFTVRNNDGQGYSAILLNDSSGECAGNYTSQCGGDIYNFNGGVWNVHHNVAMNGGDGGVAFNNGGVGLVDANYIYKCNLGIGCGATGTTAAPFTNIAMVGNLIEGCEYGILAGWFSVAGRVGPQYAKISDNKIVKPKTAGIRFDDQSPTPLMDMHITNNQVILAGSNLYDGAAGTGSGIATFNGSGTIVQGNQVVGGVGDAFVFDGNTDIVFDANVARANGGYGVRWQNSNSAQVGSFFEQTSTLGRSSGVPVYQSGIMEFTGTTNGSGAVTIAHGLGTSVTRIVPGSVSAVVKDASNVYFPMTLAYVDGTNMQFTSSQFTRPVNAKLELRPRAYPGF